MKRSLPPAASVPPSPSAHAKARQNIDDALAHLRRWAPRAVSLPRPMKAETAAGQCFRRVTAILGRRYK